MEPWNETKQLQKKYEEINNYRQLATAFIESAKILESVAEAIERDDKEAEELALARYIIKISKIQKMVDNL